jgi:hypothetical protein
MRHVRIAGLLGLGLVALLCTACASTSIRSAWFDPTFKGGPFAKIVVVGGGGGTDAASRRVFEDIFVEHLRAAGVDAVQGYIVIPDEARSGENPFSAAIQRSGADGALMVRLLEVDTRTQVTTTMVPGPGFGGWGGPWGGPWGGGFYGPSWSAVPVVSQYQLANVEANLYDVKTRQMVWAANTQTFNPSGVAQETPGFAEIIIGQLRVRGLIATGAR